MTTPSNSSNPSAASMLLQLQRTFYRLEIEPGKPGTLILHITCKFCGFELRFDDEKLEQSQFSAELFAQHLRKKHARELHEAVIRR